MSLFQRFQLSSIARIAVILLVVAAFHAFTPSDVSAQTRAWEGVCVGREGTDAEGVATIQGFQCLVGNILSIAVTGIGFAGFIMMIVGAFQYLLSGGNAKGTEGGRNTITYAVVGLVVALSSYIILRLISQFTGIEAILNFKLPSADPNSFTQF